VKAEEQQKPNRQRSVMALVLNWNRAEDTLKAVDSLLNSSQPPRLAVTVIDNGSSDSSRSLLKERLPRDVCLITNNTNLGFAEGNNVGLRRALEDQSTDYFFLLNSDALVTETTVEGLVTALEDTPLAAVAGPAIITAGGNDEVTMVESLGGRINLKNGRIKHEGFGKMWEEPGGDTQVRQVDLVSGCAFLVSRQAIEKVGLMDERFFCYLEETDWCMRMAAAGLKVLNVSSEVVRHQGGASMGGTSTAARVYFGVRNHLLLFKKNPGSLSRGRRLKRVLNILALWLLFLFFSSRIGKKEGLKMYFQGIRDHRQERYGGAMLVK